MFEQVEVKKQDGLGSQDNDRETGSAHEHQKELLDNKQAATSPNEQQLSQNSQDHPHQVNGLDAQIVGLRLLQLTESLRTSPHLCQIIDSSEYSVLSPEAWQVYVISESYNASLMDIYRTKKAEDADFSEEQLIEISYQILQALVALNRCGGLNCKSMLHFDSIYFDENGFLKL